MPEPLLTPKEGVPSLITDEAGFLSALSELQKGSGPLAVDAERASGYRYSQRAYLIQIFRRGGGLHLIDPISVNDPSLWMQMNAAFSECEWIIHASTQDLPCLRELGIYPRFLFDTELGGRIAGCERVGLGPLCEALLDLQLAKEHSAVDWSIRPLHPDWLNYAALDVDVLIDLRDAVENLLAERGKLEWAREDFAQILLNPPPPPRVDAWRRTSGLHKVRDRMTLAIIKALWEVRDQFARLVDIAPGRIFNDDALVELAIKRPTSIDEFTKIIKRKSRATNIPTTEWFVLLNQTLQLAETDLPVLRTPNVGLPPVKLWRERNYLAHARLSHVRAAVIERAHQLQLPVENLVSPEVIRQLVWKDPPQSELEKYVKEMLAIHGARPWQIENISTVLLEPMLAREPLIVASPDLPDESTGELTDSPTP